MFDGSLPSFLNSLHDINFDILVLFENLSSLDFFSIQILLSSIIKFAYLNWPDSL